MEEIKRQVAFKVRISDILKGEYKKEEGWQPNYIITEYGKVSRVNIVAVMVSKNEVQKSFVIDDGSGKIEVRFFGEANIKAEVGDPVLIIGRPREWNSQKYIMPEIVKKVKDKRWIDVRKIELKKRKNEERPVIKERKEEVLSPYQKILEIIGSLDFGKGADYHEVIAKSKVVDCERMINALLEQGEIFEIRPGKLKVLE